MKQLRKGFYKYFGVVMCLLVIIGCVGTIIKIYKQHAIQVSRKDTIQLTQEQREKLEQDEREHNKQIKEQERLSRLQNPKLIKQEFEKVGKLLVYEGKIAYTDNIKDEKFLSSKELNLDLKYKFGISIDLNKIEIVDFIEDSVIIHIQEDQLELEYIELLNKESITNSTKTWIAKDFTPDEMKIILDDAKENTIQLLHNADGVHTKSIESLKQNLDIMVLKLGYKKVIYK